MRPAVDSRWSLLGLRAVILENACLRATVLPELGGRVWSLVYKPLDRELLWQNPRVAPRKVPFGSAYDDVWCGGWEELFPNDAPGLIMGEQYPDHGEIWSIEWDWTAESDGDSAAVRLWCETPISAFRVEKRLLLRGGRPTLEASYRLTNAGGAEFPFLFKIHPALRVPAGARIDFPPMTVELEPAWLASLTGAPPRFAWPHAETGEGRLDLRKTPPPEARQAWFFYGTDYSEGWCAITDVASRLTCGLLFSPQVFTSCWLFASFGAWRNHRVAILEPATAHPMEMEKAIARGSAPTLAAGASLEATVALRVQAGLTEVGGVSPEGEFLA